MSVKTQLTSYVGKKNQLYIFHRRTSCQQSNAQGGRHSQWWNPKRLDKQSQEDNLYREWHHCYCKFLKRTEQFSWKIGPLYDKRIYQKQDSIDAKINRCWSSLLLFTPATKKTHTKNRKLLFRLCGWLLFLYIISVGNQLFSVGLDYQLFQPTQNPVEMDKNNAITIMTPIICCGMSTNKTVGVWCPLSP